MLNYSKKLDRKIFVVGLLIFTVFLLATTTQTDFAATNPINNTTNGGISGALNSSSPGDIIELDEGTYTGNNNTNMTINKNITIQGKTKDKIILDAKGLSRIFTIANNLNVTFINITFINGNTSDYGGGILNNYSDTILSVINCKFINNNAYYGGGLYSFSNIKIQDSTFNNNSAFYFGGGILLNNNINDFILNIINSNFTNNAANQGGGFCVYTGSYCNYIFNIINSTFFNNIGDFGGGIRVSVGSDVNFTMDIINSNFNNNTASQGSGVNVYFLGYSNTQINIINSTFVNNILNYSKSGIVQILGVISNENKVNIFDSRIVNNTGTGIINFGNLNMNNSIICNNTEDGIYNNGTTILKNNTICHNGDNGISNDGDAYIDNNVISGNGKDGVSNGETGTAIIVDNEISDNGGNGVTNDGDAVIDDNLISGNSGDGVNNGENGTADIVNNVIIDNEGHGISNDGDAYIDNNVISGNGKDGVNNGENGTADIVDNLITDNGGNGVTNEGNATLIDNEITDNDGDGVVNNGDLNGSGNTIGQKPILTITTNVSNRTINITVKATDKMDNIIVGATIKIYVNGILIGTRTTNNEGIVEFTYTATSVGTQNILTTMDAFNITDTDNNEILYSTANNTTTVNITTKANTRSTIVISNATSGKSTTIRGVLIDENGNTIANAPINLVIGGKSNNLVTGADGSWSLSYTPLKAGNFIAKVYYNGNSNYVASTSSLNYTVAQGTDAPKKTDIRLLKKKSSKVFRHGKRVVMKWFTYKNYGATGSKNITTKVIIKNLKYKLWKVYNKKLSYKYGNNKIKFKLNLKSGEKFKLKLKVYKPIR